MSKRLLGVVLIASTIISLGACSTSGFVNGLRWITYSQPLTEGDLQGMLSSGTRMSLNWANDESGFITYNSDGTATAEVGGKSVRGNWQTKDGKLCMNWNSSDETAGQCFTVYRARGNSLKMFDERGSFHARASGAGIS